MLPRCTGKCRHWKWQSGGSFPGSQQHADPPRAAELAVPAAGALRLGGEVVRGRKRGVCVRGEGWGSQPGCGRPNPSCVTSGKLHVTSLDLVSSSVKWGRFLCGGSERLGDLPRGTQLLAHGSRGTSWCSPPPPVLSQALSLELQQARHPDSSCSPLRSGWVCPGRPHRLCRRQEPHMGDMFSFHRQRQA